MLDRRAVPTAEFITPTGKAPELRSLLADPQVSKCFSLLVDYCKSGTIPEHVGANLFRESHYGRLALQAALLFGGLPRDAAYRGLSEIASKSENPSEAEAAATILRVSLSNRALYPGTFDPFTLGHRDILLRQVRNYDEVIVGIGVNSEKNPIFSVPERIAQIQNDLRDAPGRIRVVSFTGLAAHFAQRENCRTIIRGLRGVTDSDQETQLAHVNRTQATRDFQLDTVFVPARQEFDNIASSKVREIARLGGDIHEMVSVPIARAVQEKFAIQYLTSAWNELGLFPGDKAASDAALERVLERHLEPERHYHNAVHLFKMLKILDEYRDSISNRKALIAAVLFHDFEYDPMRKDNEDRSAAAAADLLTKGGMQENDIRIACAHILLTKRHDGSHAMRDSQLFVDADRAILASNPEEYLRYRDAIREEYRGHYNDAEFERGRRAFLKNVLDRPSLYCTDEFRFRYSEQARTNLEAEMRFLSASSAR